MALIEYSINERRVATVTFQRDGKRNAINQQMASELLARLDQLERDEARAAILCAQPDAEVWCAGHDLSELNPQALDENPTLDIVDRVRALPIPVIAMVAGHVYGGGLLILLAADLVVAADNTQVAITSNKLGIPLDPELYAFWLRVMGLHKTKELLFTGSAISAEDARRCGLFNHVVSPQHLRARTSDLADRILECSADALAHAKRVLNLLASQTALDTAELHAVRDTNRRLLEHPATRERIAYLLAALRKRS